MIRSIDTSRQSLATVLRSLREQSGKSVADIAHNAGVTPGAVRHWEQGIRSPALWQLPTIARAYGVTAIALARAIAAESR